MNGFMVVDLLFCGQVGYGCMVRILFVFKRNKMIVGLVLMFRSYRLVHHLWIVE